MKSCEFCDCNDRGYCGFRGERLEREMSYSCAGYRERPSLCLTKAQCETITKGLGARAFEIQRILDKEYSITESRKKFLKDSIEEITEVLDIIRPYLD